MQTNKQVVVMTDAVVAKGQRSWSRIKSTAVEQRQLWKDVGEALLVGRRLHKADQKFSQWCKERGFGDMDRRVRADAMWFAQSGVQPLDTTESHPTRIRMWFNEQETDADQEPDLLNAKPIKTIKLGPSVAKTVSKLNNRHESGGEGSEDAGRRLDAFSKKHGVTKEVLLDSAAAEAPEEFYQMSHDQKDTFASIRSVIQGLIKTLEEVGVGRKAIKSLFIFAANSIEE